ncbi:hypothetical protein [Micromonospora okii]|uniref:hypothetical protein n=1 Tax=Micromonospora okii TaxID=1182970 RepID=UPI001E654F5D|nr:hypothetical protein [Micromonospora okii]
MTARGGTRIRAARKPVVVLVGEDSNDRKCLRILLEEFCPQLRGQLVEVKDPARLRSAKGTLDSRVDALARLVRARAAREDADLACVFVQEDLDDSDGAEYLEKRDRVQMALEQRFRTAHYVLSTAEVEAWLLLFPDALAETVSSWRVPRQFRNRDTGTLSDPKHIMKHAVSGPARRYKETDAPDVFAKAIALGCLDQPGGTNRSWNQFRTDVSTCCRQHVPQQRSSQ